MTQFEGSSVSAREQLELIRRVLRKRWWLMVLGALVAGVAAFGATKLVSPVYAASTSVRILREDGLAEAAAAARRFERPMPGGALQAEAGWFVSRQVVEDVVRRLALADSPPGSILDAYYDKIKSYALRVLKTPPADDARFNEIVDRLRNRSIKVKELEGSNVLEVTVNWHDPEMAMRIANTLVDVFIEQYQEFSRGKARQNRTYLEQQVQLVATRLQESEKGLVDFQKKTGLVSPDDRQVGSADQANLQNLLVTMRQLEVDKATAQAQLDGIENRLSSQPKDADKSKKADNEALRAALSNPISLLRTLVGQLVNKEADAARQTSTYTNEHVGNSRVSKELAGLKTKIQEEVKRLGGDPSLNIDALLAMVHEENTRSGVSESVSAQMEIESGSLRSRIRALEEQIAKIEPQITQAQEETKKLPDELQQYMTLLRDKKVNEELHTLLCQRLAGAQVDEHSDLCDIRVFDLAQVPLVPLQPRPLLVTGLGILMGFLLGVCVAFSIEYLDDSFHSSQDIQAFLGFPVLAEIPKVRVRTRRRPALVDKTAGLVEHKPASS